MDSSTFKEWLKFWHESVTRISDGPWVLLLDNCTGHDALPGLENVAYCFLPPNTTARFQPLDQGIISMAKTAYKSGLLRKCIEALSLMTSNLGPQNQAVSRRGTLGLSEGHLPHVADAMAIMDSSWNNVDWSSIINCRVKSTCMPYEHHIRLQQLAQSLGSNAHDQSLQRHESTFKELVELSSKLNLANAPRTPVTAVLHDVSKTPLTEINDIVRREVASEKRYKNVIEKDTVLQLYESDGPGSDDITGTSLEDESIYEQAITVLEEAQKKVDSLLNDEQLNGLLKECKNRVRSLESSSMSI